MSARFLALSLRPFVRSISHGEEHYDRIIAFLTQHSAGVGHVGTPEICPELPCPPEEILELIRVGGPLPIVCVPTTTPPQSQCLDMGGVLGMESQSVQSVLGMESQSVQSVLGMESQSVLGLDGLGLDKNTTEAIEAINSFDFFHVI